MTMDKPVRIGFADEDKFERFKRINWVDFDALQRAKVLVVGAGALGNEVCKDLVLSGFQEISLVDMDHVVLSNLNRCIFFSNDDAKQERMKAEVVAEKLRRVSDDVEIRPYVKPIEDLPPDFIPSHDIVFGCLDNILARLHLNASCFENNIPYIDGAMVGFIGKVHVILPPDGPCLECGMNKTHAKIAELKFSCTGKDITFVEPKLAAEITTTSVISAIQVRESIKIVSGRKDFALRNVFFYNGATNSSDVYRIAINPDCRNHD